MYTTKAHYKARQLKLLTVAILGFCFVFNAHGFFYPKISKT